MTALSEYLIYIERYLLRNYDVDEDDDAGAIDEEEHEYGDDWPFPPDGIEYDEELYWYPYVQ